MTFERQATTKDAAGQISDTWSTICERMVAIEPISGREYFNASGERSEITSRISVRYDIQVASIKAFDRGVIGAVVYELRSGPMDKGDRNRFVEFMARVA